MENLRKILPAGVSDKIVRLCGFEKITQIRMRINNPVIINLFDKEILFGDFIADDKMLTEVFNKITGYSAYAFEENIRCGYVTIKGGHRVGFGGEVVAEKGDVITVKNIKFLNIRVCHCIEGCSKIISEHLAEEGKVLNSLIISPPGLGKTTLLRDIIVYFSNKITGTSISVIDERNEISGSYMGVPTIDMGPRTDVISGCSKEYGIRMAIRSMAPKIIAVDEIGGKNDLEALQYAAVSGVKILATIHGKNLKDAEEKLGQAFNEIFDKKILITGKGKYECF